MLIDPQIRLFVTHDLLTFDLAQRHLLTSKVLLLHPFQLFLHQNTDTNKFEIQKKLVRSERGEWGVKGGTFAAWVRVGTAASAPAMAALAASEAAMAEE
jgi:hypothetical protein